MTSALGGAEQNSTAVCAHVTEEHYQTLRVYKISSYIYFFHDLSLERYIFHLWLHTWVVRASIDA